MLMATFKYQVYKCKLISKIFIKYQSPIFYEFLGVGGIKL